MVTTKREGSEKEEFRILLIEDDPHIARLVEANLGKAKMALHHAYSGDTGLRIFGEVSPHLVLLDLMLPDIDGYEICRKLRERSNVPIIMITARTELEDQMRGFKVGADDYVTKPFDPSLLVARVIANLRRFYHYGSAPTAGGNGSEGPDTANWTTCPSCHYMGPGEKFEVLDERFQMKQVCPHCATPVRGLKGKLELQPA